MRIEQVLRKAQANDHVYNWTVNYLYKFFREAPIPFNSEVYNFIGEHFIVTEPEQWNDAAFVKKVQERVIKSKLNPIGEKATNLKLQTSIGEIVELDSVNAPLTILYFFNPGCEACQSATEKLIKLYHQYKFKGMQVFAVYDGDQMQEWLDYISTKGLDWINVYDPMGTNEIEQKYDIYAIPMIYLLDKDKNVIAKDILVDQIETFIK